jgi:hypothetical protein
MVLIVLPFLSVGAIIKETIMLHFVSTLSMSEARRPVELFMS